MRERVSVNRNEPAYAFICDNRISESHAELRARASMFDDFDGSDAHWGIRDAIVWGATSNYYGFKSPRKLEFIEVYSEIIKEAARVHDIPILLLAGVAYIEFGGMPDIANEIVYTGRMYGIRLPDIHELSSDEDNESLMARMQGIINRYNRDIDAPANTSFGNINMQLRRAFETLGYEDPTPEQREEVIRTLQNSVENIFIAAQHLSDLRNIDLRGIVDSNNFTEDDIILLGARYNIGSTVTLDWIREDTSRSDVGIRILQNRDYIMRALEGR